MRYLRYFALVAVLMVPLAYSQAQVSVGVAVGPGYIGPAPVCAYGYYDYYPYACAPYGYYGPRWFVNGIFIGAGPWYHGYGRYWVHDGWGRGPYWERGYRGAWNHERFEHGGYGRGYARGGYYGGYHGGGYHGGGGFHGGFYGGRR